MNIEFDKYLISDDKSKLQLESVHALLKTTYWAKERTRETIAKAIENSVCFGAYADGQQIGFARAVTDYATMFWLCDVVIDERYRGRGIGKALIESILHHGQLKSLFSIIFSSDSQSLYEKYSFHLVNHHFMRRDP